MPFDNTATTTSVCTRQALCRIGPVRAQYNHGWQEFPFVPLHRSHQMRLPADVPDVDPETYLQRTTRHDRSWGPDWQESLANRPCRRARPPAMGNALCDASGTYVLA